MDIGSYFFGLSRFALHVSDQPYIAKFEHEIHGVMQPRENQDNGVAGQTPIQNNTSPNLASVEYYMIH